jgi:hypothetical protein
MEARFRVLDIVGIGAFIDVLDGTYRYSVFFFPTEVWLGFPDFITSVPLDDLSQVHTYTITSSSSSSTYDFLRDGVLLGTGTASQTPLNGFQWGVGGSEGDVDWDYVAFGQPALTPIVVGVDIKPNSEKNTVNICAKGGIDAAILGASNFDATQVNPLTVDLAGASVKLGGKDQEPQTKERDVNSDGITDLVLKFEAAEISLDENASEAILNGQTFASELIQGADAVNIKQQMCMRSVEAE